MNSRDPFEQRLARTPIRRTPDSLRALVLEATRQRAVEARKTEAGACQMLRAWITRWVWPSPAAWGTLGLAWIIIVLLNLAALSLPGPVPAKSRPPAVPRAWTTALREQRALLQNLLQESSAAALPAEPGPDARVWPCGSQPTLIA